VLIGCAVVSAGCKSGSNASKKQPTADAATANPAIVEVQRGKDSAFTMLLAVDPAQPRFGRKTRFDVKVTDSAGAPVNNAQAHISLVMALMDMGKNEFDLKSVGDGTYQGAGEFTMAGEWEVVATASAGGKNGKYTFNIKVAE
jgi:hypothetical protein